MVDADRIMNELSKYYRNNRMTTLNRMRKNPDPFKILIGSIVSINIKDEVCEEILERLFERIGSFQDIIDIDIIELENILYKARYRRVKAARLKEISKRILSEFRGNVSSNKDDLLSIKGIGPKTCNIVLSFAFRKKVIPVDTNVHRIFNRIGLVNTNKVEDTEIELLRIVSDKYLYDVNGIAMMHGKKICVPISPFCSRCPIESFCAKKGVKKRR